MTRPLSGPMAASIAATRAQLVHFMQLEASGGAIRITTYPQDVDWSGETWQGIGGSLIPGAAVESADLRGGATTLELSGVSQVIISLFLTNYTRGREAVIYFGHIDEDTGLIVADPIEVFRGFLNEPWEVREQPPRDGENGTATVKTRVVSRVAQLSQPRPVRTNIHSHRNMLRRGGLSGGALDDNFFKHVPAIAGRPIFYGTESPAGTNRGTPEDPDDRGGRPTRSS